MSKYTIRQYTPALYDKWNEFVENSNNGTLFHRLDFLKYHGNRFKENEHHLVWFKGETLYAIMPMGVFQEDKKRIAKTPFGASFGGIVYKDNLSLKNSMEIVDLLINYLQDIKVSEFHYINQPVTYFNKASIYLDYALLSKRAFLFSKDIFNIIPLQDNWLNVLANFEGRARTTIKKHINDFDIKFDASIEEFYPILLEDKVRHNNSKPTHLLDDLIYLKTIFPNRLIIDIAIHKTNKSKASICYFVTKEKHTVMTFYISQENKAKGLNGSNILLYHGIKRAVAMGFEFFDFGGSTIGYQIDNLGVAIFKESFGALGFSRDYFKIVLKG